MSESMGVIDNILCKQTPSMDQMRIYLLKNLISLYDDKE
jgi:hypothetical protein